MLINIIVFLVSTLVGSGMFLLIGLLPQFGFINGVIGFLISFILFFFIGLVFAQTEESPFKLMEKALGKRITFLISWMLWLISWVSLLIIINEIILFAAALYPILNNYVVLFQVLVLGLTISLNMFGMQNSSKIEIIITILKICPLILIAVLCFFKTSHPIILNNIPINFSNIAKNIPAAIWCFVGIESIILVGNQFKASKIYGFLIGMGIVLGIFLLNIFAVYKIFGNSFNLQRPHTELMGFLFNDFSLVENFGGKIFNIIAMIVCFGSLNSCTVSNSLIAYDMSKTGYFPKLFQKINQYSAPYISILASSLGLIPFFFLLKNKEVYLIIKDFIDLSSSIFLLFYSVLCLSIYLLNKNNFFYLLVTILSFIILFISTSLTGLIYCIIFFISGLFPMFIFKIGKETRKNN